MSFKQNIIKNNIVIIKTKLLTTHKNKNSYISNKKIIKNKLANIKTKLLKQPKN